MFEIDLHDPVFWARMALVPLLGALTGYCTNWLAVRMLFRPRNKKRIFGISVQGLLPRRRSELAQSIGETVQEHLISHDDVRAALSDPRARRQIESILDLHVARFVDEKLPNIHPMAGMFLGGGMRDKIHRMILDQLLEVLEPLTERLMDNVEESLDLQKIVTERIEAFDIMRLERIILRIAGRELRAIEVWGGVLGFMIGILTDLLLLI